MLHIDDLSGAQEAWLVTLTTWVLTTKLIRLNIQPDLHIAFLREIRGPANALRDLSGVSYTTNIGLEIT